jgi:uncharacterized protein
MAAHPSFVCPKCHGKMRRYERSGIVVEQCEECRGVFLDYGELERLIDAEGGGWSGRVGAPGADNPYDAGAGHERLDRLRDLFGKD